MKPLTLIIVLITCASSYGLSCLTNGNGKSLIVPLDKFDSENVTKMIQDLRPIKYANNILCRIELAIDYNEQLLIVKFTEHLKDSSLKNQYVQIDVFVGGDEIEDIVVNHFLEYACSDDECEKNFIKKHIDWFVKADYAALQEKLSPLILGDGKEPGE
jgi:hypothetical protein